MAAGRYSAWSPGGQLGALWVYHRIQSDPSARELLESCTAEWRRALREDFDRPWSEVKQVLLRSEPFLVLKDWIFEHVGLVTDLTMHSLMNVTDERYAFFRKLLAKTEE